MMITLALVHEETLIVSRSRHGSHREGQLIQQGLPLSGMLNSDTPRPVRRRPSHDANIAAGIDGGIGNAHLLQDLGGTVRRIALGNAPKADGHSRALQPHTSVFVDEDAAVIDQR